VDINNLFGSPADKGAPYIDTVLRLDPSQPAPLPDSNALYQTDPNNVKKEMLLKAENRIISSEPGGYVISPRGFRAGTATGVDSVTAIQELSTTSTTVPYTDEDGYQLVGGFPYGRELNPVLISSETAGPPTFKDVNLLTMPRPLYQSESDAMGVLFFDNEEGAVPAYLNLGQTTPKTLGAIVDTTPTIISNRNTVLTADLQAQSNVSQVQQTVTPDVVNAMTNATGTQEVPSGAMFPPSILEQLRQQVTQSAPPSTTSVPISVSPVTAITAQP
jgi:hypothetical protein